jgi:hypothetical protein
LEKARKTQDIALSTNEPHNVLVIVIKVVDDAMCAGRSESHVSREVEWKSLK